MEKLHERKINDSYKLLKGKCFEEIQRVTNNPVIKKKVAIIPFSGESCNPRIL
ncbi:cytochrome c biogenesis protein [Iris pallida]|uniref:Cytochrome c biogenesis protein (Chloroplast) n=1 Tax=Iris pallida TaxID=29817 RepID=A0AAX6G4W6_IRIPA|nr:cytochrome c biogenesis protein [Iris pallida]